MPAVVTTVQLYANLRKSGLIPPEKFQAALDDAPSEEAPSVILERLVRSGHLTRYQAEKLAVGKYKGFVLGPYIIQDRLGGGGMGHVFLAEHTAMRRKVALKVLSIGSMHDQVARERFFREARVAAGLDHPHIIRVFDLRREDAVCYLVMEYIDGESLQGIVQRHGPLPWQTAVTYARQVAIGLQYAHENGLVHRDIKPANLLLGRDGLVKIIDLGLVRWDAEADSKLTEQVDKSILGTADYLAPEQAVNSATVDIRADLYSLGATLYYLIAGRTIFPEGKTAQKLMWQQLKEPTPIRNLEPEIPEALAAVIHKCLAKAPEQRYSSPNQLAEALKPWSSPTPIEPDPEWIPTTRKRVTRIKGEPELPTDSRLLPLKKPTLESTVLPPMNRSTASASSHLMEMKPNALTPTVSDINTDTPLRMTKPRPMDPLVSHIYARQSTLDRDTPPLPARKNSMALSIMFVIVLTLLAFGIALLMKVF